MASKQAPRGFHGLRSPIQVRAVVAQILGLKNMVRGERGMMDGIIELNELMREFFHSSEQSFIH